ALEKDRNRRYETANGFAMDVQRYLADEPVQACPPSAWYRFRKFARRNKSALTVAVLASAALVLAGVVPAGSHSPLPAGTQAKEQALEDKLNAESERANEVTKRANAEKKRADAENERAGALSNWRQTAYYLKTALGLDEYRASNVAQAEQMLDECPEDLRHWE